MGTDIYSMQYAKGHAENRQVLELEIKSVQVFAHYAMLCYEAR